MGELAGVFILLAVGALLSGPVALILTLTLFGRIGRLEEKLRWLSTGQKAPVPPKPAVPWPVVTPPVAKEPVPVAPPVPPKPVFQIPPVIKPTKPAAPKVGLEQKIGTTVVLIAGIITVIVGVGFFLKFIYDHAYFGPLARVAIVAGGGAAAMLIGEITRRRGYEIVAKGVTAMGFALLYVAVFSASRVYMLIETQTAFVLAMAITAGAMAYAVALNEVVIAFLSLLGGYLSPIIISTGQNLAMPLFSYLLALSLGALGCAMFRRWRAVNWIALVGTYLLFTGWFEKFYTPSQMAMTLLWLTVFGSLFLVQPILYGVVRKAVARAEDVGLIVANSAAVFYYLWRILSDAHPQAQAIAAAIVGLAHLALMAAVILRCREDRKLQAALGVLGTAFLTTAIGLYFSALNPTLLSWSVEAVALTFIGIRYRSLWAKAMAMVVSAIAALGLFYHLPLHGAEAFRFVFNAPFGIWLFVSAAFFVCHALWRFMAEAQDDEGCFVAQAYYLVGVLLILAACAMEWLFYCRADHGPGTGWPLFLQGMMVIAAVLTTVLAARPLCPKGSLVRTAGVLAALGGAVFVVCAMPEVHKAAFIMFANRPFALAAVFVAAMLAAAWRVRQVEPTEPQGVSAAPVLGLAALILVWILLSQEVYYYWYCHNRYAGPVDNWRFSAQMYLSVTWAVYAAALMVGGFVSRTPGVRYLSLTVFAVLLAKIFLKDTTTLRVEYRIAAFLTTGLILVGVSFIYQFLKKKGFFEEKPADTTPQIQEQPPCQ